MALVRYSLACCPVFTSDLLARCPFFNNKVVVTPFVANGVLDGLATSNDNDTVTTDSCLYEFQHVDVRIVK